MSKEYLSCADTAKLVRAALKREFPGVKFSVRSHTYAGGASIDIDWTDGPQSQDVDDVAGIFAGAGFDGMIDLKTYNSHWLFADGHVETFQSGVGHSFASMTHTVDFLGEDVDYETSRDYIAGVRIAYDEPTASGYDASSVAFRAGQDDAQLRKSQGARLVHFGADYVFTHRELSPAVQDRLKRAIAFLNGDDPAAFDGGKRYEPGFAVGGRCFYEYGWTLLHQLSHVSQADLDEALNREAARRPVQVSDGRALCWRVTDGAWRLAWQVAA